MGRKQHWTLLSLAPLGLLRDNPVGVERAPFRQESLGHRLKLIATIGEQRHDHRGEDRLGRLVVQIAEHLDVRIAELRNAVSAHRSLQSSPHRRWSCWPRCHWLIAGDVWEGTIHGGVSTLHRLCLIGHLLVGDALVALIGRPVGVAADQDGFCRKVVLSQSCFFESFGVCKSLNFREPIFRFYP
jgi:hypothetical protein